MRPSSFGKCSLAFSWPNSTKRFYQLLQQVLNQDKFLEINLNHCHWLAFKYLLNNSLTLSLLYSEWYVR